MFLKTVQNSGGGSTEVETYSVTRTSAVAQDGGVTVTRVGRLCWVSGNFSAGSGTATGTTLFTVNGLSVATNFALVCVSVNGEVNRDAYISGNSIITNAPLTQNKWYSLVGAFYI